jgi:hypothetical protein
MPVTNTFLSSTAEALVSRLSPTAPDRLEIPEHQRDFVWLKDKQVRLIQTVLLGRPMPSILLRQLTSAKTSLEDGFQRLTTLKDYFEGRLTVDGRKFADLPIEAQVRMKMYMICVIQYAGATDEDAIDIFDSFQNGEPLSVGERLHSLAALSPLVRAIRTHLLTAGAGFYDRAVKVWGSHTLKSGKRCSDVVNIFAVCAGLLFGPDAISQKWKDIRHFCRMSMDDAFEDSAETREAVLLRRLDQMLSIFEEAQVRKPISLTGAALKKHFNPKYLSAYIAYSLYVYPDDFERVKAGWVDFIVRARSNADLFKTCLHKDTEMSKTRSWTEMRWRLGYLRVFDPTEADRQVLELEETAAAKDAAKSLKAAAKAAKAATAVATSPATSDEEDETEEEEETDEEEADEEDEE